MAGPQWAAFTSTSVGGLLNVLKNQCGISQAFNPSTAGSLATPVVQFDAIWDTGATNSCITQAVIDACGLVPISMAQVHGVHGPAMEEVFLVSIHLPGGVRFPTMRVTRAKLIGADILIGMDVMNQGDFAVTNHGGLTKFSFRIPSQKHIDFYEQHQALQKQFAHGKPSKNKKKK